MSTAGETAHEETDEHEGGEEHAHKLNLKVEVKDAGPCLKHVRVTVPREDIEHFYEHAVDDLGESAAVPGFRVGKVPKALLQKRFRDELRDQVKQRLLVDISTRELVDGLLTDLRQL